ncbi:DUF4410 domain-containing protein [candidate division KSB1 bacterium]
MSKIRKVGSGKRFLLGFGAGRSSLTTDIIFIDSLTDNELGSFSITEETGTSGYSGTTETVIKKIAKSIADLILSNI